MSDETDPAAPAVRAPSAWLWHVYLFFRPRRFFESFAVQSAPWLTVACAWMYGMSSVIDRMEMQSLKGREIPWDQNWNHYWLFLLAAGAGSGVFSYLIGGWWYRVRVRWSGARAPDKRLARRVYMFASQVAALPAVVTVAVETSVYETPLASMEAASWWYLPLLVFPFWGTVTSYIGVRTLFDVGRVRALWWFVALPSLFYLMLLVGVFVALAFGNFAPDLNNPKRFRGEALVFSYPGNWWHEVEDVGPGAESVTVEGWSDSFVRVAAYVSYEEPAAEVERTLESLGESSVLQRGESTFDRWSKFEGAGATASYVEDGTKVEVVLFATRLDERILEVQLYFTEGAGEGTKAAAEQIGGSLSLLPLDLSPDLEGPLEYEGEALSFSYPGDWWLEVEETDPGSESVTVEGLSDGYMRIVVYTTHEDLEAEIEYTLGSIDEDEMARGDGFDRWGDFEGVGGTLSYSVEGDRVHVWAFATQRGARVLEVQLYYGEVHADVVLPVLDLIAQTVRWE